MFIREMRPSEIVWAYWDEVLAIEENAERFEVVFIDVDLFDMKGVLLDDDWIDGGGLQSVRASLVA